MNILNNAIRNNLNEINKNCKDANQINNKINNKTTIQNKNGFEIDCLYKKINWTKFKFINTDKKIKKVK